MGTFDRDSDGMDVFIRVEDQQGGIPEPAGVPPNRNRSMFSIINAVLLMLILAAALASAWYVYRDSFDFSSPVEDSHPYQASQQYALSYDEIVTTLGEQPMAVDGGGTAIDAQFGTGTANVHLSLSGSTGQTEAFFTWRQKDDGWRIESASYLRDGERIPIPLGPGAFLSPGDLNAWRDADPNIPLGKGQRALIAGQTFEAVSHLNSVVESEPTNSEALVWRGRAFEALGNDRKALADYTRVLSFDPKNAAAHGRLDAMRASLPPGSAPPAPPSRLEQPVPQTPATPPSSLIPL